MKKKVAVLVCGWSRYFVRDFITGIQKLAKQINVDVYIFNGYNYTEFSGYPNSTGFSVFSLINYEDFDGIIILSDLISNQMILERERLKIIKSGKKAVSINKQIAGLDYIKVDNYTGLYQLMNHLIKDHGYKDFGYIGGKEKSIDFAERYKAYRTSLLENNLKIDLEKVYTVEITDFQFSYEFLTNFVKSGKKLPEVLVCANDLVALSALKVAQENNIKVPEELKIVGYDDLYFAGDVKPGISTVKNDNEAIGEEAFKRVLGYSSAADSTASKILSKPVIRNTCGCNNQIQFSGNVFSFDLLNSKSEDREFFTQMEVIEEIFTEAPDVFTLLTNLESFFAGSHYFEGNDFCVFLKSDWSSVLINSEERLGQNLSYGNQVQSIVSVQNGKKYTNEVISTRSLVPSKMKSDEESSTFMFMPIFNHSYVFGYIVIKNSLKMLNQNYGYTWTRTFGTSIELFRKRNMYKQMSQSYLKLSTQDALSGMMNRVGLERIAIPFYEQNKNNNLTSILYFIDINRMKLINDNFGHLHGDLAVKTVAASVLQVVPKNWQCIRYGGDEFLVVGNSRFYKGEDYCTLITQALARKTSVMHLPYMLSCSVGTYQVPPNSPLTLEQAVEQVDKIMYAKKEQMHKMMDAQNNMQGAR